MSQDPWSDWAAEYSAADPPGKFARWAKLTEEQRRYLTERFSIQEPPYAGKGKRYLVGCLGVACVFFIVMSLSMLISPDKEQPAGRAPSGIGRTAPSTPSGSSSEFIDPSELPVGKRYRVSRQVPLMPERRPRDPIEAIGRMSSLEPGGEFTILEVSEDTGFPWYRVRTTSGEWWINGVALLGQELYPVN